MGSPSDQKAGSPDQKTGCFVLMDWTPGPGTEIGDLYSLAACDYIIGPPSTYTQWASFYGQVPRFVHNRKYEEKSGMVRMSPTHSNFTVHINGFGRFAS